MSKPRLLAIVGVLFLAASYPVYRNSAFSGKLGYLYALSWDAPEFFGTAFTFWLGVLVLVIASLDKLFVMREPEGL